VTISPTERPDAYLVEVGGRPQSYVDLADPTRLEFDYVRRMGDVLDAFRPAGEPVRVLHVGGAGLTLPRYVAHTRPRSAQVVLEPDAELTELVRRELPLPRQGGIKVRPVDGRSGLTAVREDSQDAVVVDAFVDGLVPPELVTAECAAEYARVLAPGGVLLLNLVDRAPFTEARRVVAAVRTALPVPVVGAETATLRGKRDGNVLVVAGADVPLGGGRDYRVFRGVQVGDAFGGG
jgi:spermidine synthase